MNIAHCSEDSAISKDVNHPVAFILVGERKDFATFYGSEESRYEGFFVARGDSFVKTLSRIIRGAASDGDSSAVPEKLEFYRGKQVAARRYSNAQAEAYSLVHDEPVLIYETFVKNKPAADKLTVRLDMRDQFYIPQWGRDYEVYDNGNAIIVRYSDDRLVEPIFLAILHDGTFTKHGNWVAVEYRRDLQRNSLPAALYEYVLGEFTASKLVFAFGDSADQALERAHANAGRSNVDTLIKKRLKPKQANGKLDAFTKELARAYAKDALDALYIDGRMLAGMPWFTKAWVRDELISAPAMPKERLHAIIAKYIGAAWDGGKFPVIFGGANYCSDGLGLLAWAIIFGKVELGDLEKRILAGKLEAANEALEAMENELGFIPSGERESWMDSIGRVGYPVETQALYVRILHLAELLSEKKGDYFRDKRYRLVDNIRTHYFVDGYLHDRLYDDTMRPNVFLAAMYAPEILTKADWEKCFDAILPSLWLSWGGLASVDSRHEYFCDLSTGECDTSYHNGDSWFFVNNIAALVMHHTNAKKYAKYIDEIYDASTREILWHNYAGYPGEISSARMLESWGCGLQGFSAAAYVYLVDHVPLKRRALKDLFTKASRQTSLF